MARKLCDGAQTTRLTVASFSHLSLRSRLFQLRSVGFAPVEKLPALVNSGSRIRFAKREARDHVWRSLSNGWPSQRDYDLMQRNGCSDDFVSIFRDDRLRSGGLAATLDGAG